MICKKNRYVSRGYRLAWVLRSVRVCIASHSNIKQSGSWPTNSPAGAADPLNTFAACTGAAAGAHRASLQILGDLSRRWQQGHRLDGGRAHSFLLLCHRRSILSFLNHLRGPYPIKGFLDCCHGAYLLRCKQATFD